VNDNQDDNEYIYTYLNPVKYSAEFSSFDTFFIWLTSSFKFPSFEYSWSIREYVFYKKNQKDYLCKFSLR